MSKLKGEVAKRYGRGAVRFSIWCLLAGALYGSIGTIFFYFVFRGITVQ